MEHRALTIADRAQAPTGPQPASTAAGSIPSNGLSRALVLSPQHSPRQAAQRQIMHELVMPKPGGVVQRVKVKALDEMPNETQQAVELLNYLHDPETISEFMREPAVKAVRILESGAYAQYCAGLIEVIRAKLPPEAFRQNKPSTLNQRNIHSIWVQGDYAQEQEVAQGLQSRQDSGAQRWTNLIWVYQDATQQPGFEEVSGLVRRPIRLHGLDLSEVDFKSSMAAWKDKPGWVSHFLPLLDILLAKKSYVTMSDIMRMIILYYQGGLYQDVKIQLADKNAKFFDEPLVNADKLQLADGGPNKENWAMVAEAGCKMIADIMEATVPRFPSPEKLLTMPENYTNSGKYSKAHATLHENKGPWNRIESFGGKTEGIGQVNESLKLRNPRPVNSWAHTDEVPFDWDS